jgi:hypothetical protein
MALNPADKKNEEIADEIIREFNAISGSRGVWEAHWEEIAQRVLPAHSGSFSASSQFRTPGSKRTQEIFDSTAAVALNRFGAILDSLLTPRNQTWHKLSTNDSSLNRDRQVKLYYESVNRILFEYRYSPRANFSSQNQQNYKSLGAFGTGSLFTDELKVERGLRYRAVHLGEIYFDENHQGLVDKAYRYFPLSARQAAQKFGSEKLPSNITTALASSPDRQFNFIHCVKPREDRDPERMDSKGMAFAAYYVSMEGKKLLMEEGYSTFPYAISRYEQSPGELYGRSPAMDVLPAIKTLNEQKKTLLKQGHRAVDPVLLVHDDGIIDTFSLKSGALNAGGVSADGRPLVQALPVGNISAGKDMMMDERTLINDAFLVNIFQILTETPSMTATEVMERTREKGILLAPTIGRQQSEYLGPLIEREIDLLSRQFLLPPMPQILKEAQGEYKIVYDSPLTRAQRAEEASGAMRTIENAMGFFNATQDPSVFDFFNMDEIVMGLAEIQGMPAKWTRGIDEVQAIRAGRKDQQETEQMINAAPSAAAMIKAGAMASRGSR